MINFTEKTIETIEMEYPKKLPKRIYSNSVDVRNGFRGASIYINDCFACRIDEITEIMEQLNAIKEILNEKIGIEV